jgi:hypothetical protein
MQLDRRSPLRARLGAAACVLLAAARPAPAAAADTSTDPAPGTAATQLELSGLVYGEKGRTNVLEPTVKVTRLFANGQKLTAEGGYDSMTGASPTGGVASLRTQTTTSASGTSTSIPASTLPTAMFRDQRESLDLGWSVPLGPFTASTGGHFSHEKDYRSLGGNAVVTLDLFQKTVQLTGGGGWNHDQVDPVGGAAIGLTPGDPLGRRPDPKRVSSMLAGISRVMSRRWLAGVSATREVERGYLTEPYKILDVLDPTTLESVQQLREKRPELRTRTSVMASSTYHFGDAGGDVGYFNYRWYTDDWGVRSSTADVKWRHDLDDAHWIQPHVRAYVQHQADFFRYYLVNGEPLPAFASSDERLGALRTVTVGATYGFRMPNWPGEWSVRAEYLRQWGPGQLTRPGATVGGEDDGGGGGTNGNSVDLMPGLNIGSVLVSYTIGF